MIPFHKAKEIILENAEALNSEKVHFLDAYHRVLAEDILSPIDLPHYNRSAMDGYAVRSQDIKNASHEHPAVLTVIDKIQAGYISHTKVENSTAIKIMTGGMLPEGADTIVIKEDTRLEGDRVFICKAIPSRKNICFIGEDIKKRHLVLKKGAFIDPSHIGVFAALGISIIPVYRKPKVAILSTGDELLDINDELEPGKVRNSNQYALYSLVQESDGVPHILNPARDIEEDLINKIQAGLESDILLTTGGVSVGDFDLVGDVFKKLAITLYFTEIAVKPGKPVIFGKKNKTLVFGLPGNPVSAMISFYEFVRPAIFKMQNSNRKLWHEVEAIVAEDIKLKKDSRKILRTSLEERDGQFYVKLAAHQGSGNILSMAWADSLLEVDEDTEIVPKGGKVKVRLLS